MSQNIFKHHAYLIEGNTEECLKKVFEIAKDLEIKVADNPDYVEFRTDTLKVDDARYLKSLTQEKSASSGKRAVVIIVNNFLLEAQNTMLKMFEEPIEDTHFFLVVPDADALLPTLSSRFYLIKNNSAMDADVKNAEKFIGSNLPQRIDFIKELLADKEDEDDPALDSNRSKAKKFLNALEVVLHKQIMRGSVPNAKIDFFNQIFKAREFLRTPGSSTKSLMEGVALIIPR